MQAQSSLIYFPKQSKRARCKSHKSDSEKPKATVLEWIRNGYQFPGKPLPPAKPPKPTPGPISIPPSPDNPPQKPNQGGAR